VNVFDKLQQLQIGFGADRQVGMATFRGGHEPATGKFMHRGGVEAGADADHQLAGVIARLARSGHDRAQGRVLKVAQRMTLCLQVVQDRHGFGPRRRRKAGAVDRPVEVGHRGHAVPDRPRHGDTGPGTVHIAFGRHERRQHHIQRGVFGIGIAADRVGQQPAALGQRHTGIGAADIGQKRETVGRSGHRVLSRARAPRARAIA